MAPAGLQLRAAHPLMEELPSLRAAVARNLFSGRSAHPCSKAATPSARHVCAVRAGSAPRGRERAPAHRIPSLFSSPLLLLGARRATESPDTVVELTLSLRRLAAKLTVTESALSEHTLALATANTLAAEKPRAVHEAYALDARARGREEDGVVRILPPELN
ncbi:hypothetical protein FB451DRAFT_1402477 [Mycena latifolia]|nr:hypothetical protein FB451DRAFT_1402477 [Mycena latifolia]